jgi:hypothetical protein
MLDVSNEIVPQAAARDARRATCTPDRGRAAMPPPNAAAQRVIPVSKQYAAYYRGYRYRGLKYP